MTQKYDYKKVIESVKNKIVSGDISSEHKRNGAKWYQTVFTKEETDIILHALKLADKVTDEPSFDMVIAAMVADAKVYKEFAFKDGTCGAPIEVYKAEEFKAMINEACKEIK